MTALPTVDELSADLRSTTPGQRRLTLARPYLGIAVFAVVAWLGWWWLTPLVVFGIFVAIVGSWVYPLLTVYLPHHHYGDEPLTQTRTLRGRVIPAIFLEFTYHLEHHLYPQVPSHNLPELSRRLEPYFSVAGVRPVVVP